MPPRFKPVLTGFALCLFVTGIAWLPALPQETPISVSNGKPRQGQTIEVYSSIDPGLSAEPCIKFNRQIYKLFPFQGRQANFRVLLSIPADLKPGIYSIKQGDRLCRIEVLPGGFPVQRIHLPARKDNFNLSPGEAESVDRAKSVLSGERMWTGKFSQPARARISTVFGVRRMVNGRLLPDYYHAGIDFAAPLNAPVKACAPGRVVLVGRNFKLHGNTLAIDHGQGIVSFYIHLQKILVKPGQEVKEGETIGRVGQTGRANGPHLHFSLYVNQVATNPSDWFTRTF